MMDNSRIEEVSRLTTDEYCSFSSLSPEDWLEGEARRRSRNKIMQYYPEKGPLRRELYGKHMECFAAGRDHRERLFLAGNRCGKTEGVGAYEMAVHLSGRYPVWWEGRRFDRPISAWAAGDTNQTTRDILQAKLLGKVSRRAEDTMDAESGLGTGMIPGDAIRSTAPKAGLPDAIEVAYVRHASGGTSVLRFKSFESGREAFQGTEQDVVWLDEEPPADVYIESLMRTMGTGSFAGGIVLLTFTPLNGWSEVIGKFLNEEERAAANRHVTQASWDDVPHLSESEKAEMLATLPPYLRDARTKGIPQLGAGAIYQIPESELTEKDFEIPRHFPRAYALDPAWNRTAALWGALDPHSGVVHLYAEHYYAHMEAGENARAIRARGEWIPGIVDPAARGRSAVDGQQLMQNYLDLGLDLTPAVNTREAGIQLVWERMLSGRLKVFASLANFWKEYRLYRRDDKGQIVKKHDHLMDCLRYLIISGRDRMRVPPVKRNEPPRPCVVRDPRGGSQSWMR